MNARYLVPALFAASSALLACSSSAPGTSEASGSGGGGSSTTTATAPGTGGGTTSSSSSGGVDAGPCTYGATYCSGSDCTCQLSPPSPNCVTADANGTPSGDCDDGNPCTQDVADPSAPDGCRHEFAGLGSSCSADNAMQCVVGGTGEQCCPVDPRPTCSAEGVQAECAAGSVCLEGACWISCTGEADCIGAPGPLCDVLAVGHVSVHVCGN
jgi:hypothetical protein